MKKLLVFLSIFVSLNASVLKESELERIKKEKEKSSLEAKLLKDSWINPINISGDISKNKTSNMTSSTKRVYLDIDQDIFRSGGIFYTIQKAKEQNNLSQQIYAHELDTKETEALKLVLSINKIDLQIKKQDYIIKNKKIEIVKKEEEYLNGTTSIEELDNAVIEKNELENEIEDFKISKYNLLREFKNYSSTSYKKIVPIKLELISLENFLKTNRTLIINKLNSSISKYEKEITSSNYLPKISLFSQFGYEHNNRLNNDKNFYNYGLKITIPLDYNMNKNKEMAKVNYRLSKIEENQKKEEEINSFQSIFKSLENIERKIENGKSTINSYENIYSLTKDLVAGFIKTKEDLKTIENRLSSSKLDIKILEIDKQLLIYDINKNSRSEVFTLLTLD